MRLEKMPIFIFFLSFYYIDFSLFAKGDLTRVEPIEIKVSLIGKEGKSHHYEPSVLNFETGNLYKLKIINKTNSKHYFYSEKFSKSIFTRKIQVVRDGENIAEVKGIINKVEIFPKSEVEWWFIPIKTGVFKDLLCNVKDNVTKMEHSEMGMTGTIIFK